MMRFLNIVYLALFVTTLLGCGRSRKHAEYSPELICSTMIMIGDEKNMHMESYPEIDTIRLFDPQHFFSSGLQDCKVQGKSIIIVHDTTQPSVSKPLQMAVSSVSVDSLLDYSIQIGYPYEGFRIYCTVHNDYSPSALTLVEK